MVVVFFRLWGGGGEFFSFPSALTISDVTSTTSSTSSTSKLVLPNKVVLVDP